MFLALRAYSHTLSNTLVNSQPCVQIAKTGSTKLDLLDLSFRVFKICLERKIDLRIEWIPISQNQIANYISKIHDTDDWEV